MSPPTIQILEKADYTKQHIVSLPDALPYPPLPPSSIRLQSRIISLTTNNLTYAKLGHLLGWWDVHPLPPSTPAHLNDSKKYGRISAWGYGEIMDSTVPELPVGKTLFGYIPIGTLPTDLEVQVSGSKKDQVWVSNEYRAHLMPIYNRYHLCPSISDMEKATSKDSLGWDSLMQVLFLTSYCLNVYGLAWDPKRLVQPAGDPNLPWTKEDADIAGAVIVILSASGKTALAFAHQLRHGRPQEHQPSKIIGVCSTTSKPFVQGTNFYDEVMLYSDSAAASDLIKEHKPKKILMVDFGAREGVMPQWHSALTATSTPLQFLGVGSETQQQSSEEMLESIKAFQKFERVQVNASGLKEGSFALAGEEGQEELYKSWEGFKRGGAIPGVRLEWKRGMEEWEGCWERLVEGGVGGNVGLLFEL